MCVFVFRCIPVSIMCVCVCVSPRMHVCMCAKTMGVPSGHAVTSNKRTCVWVCVRV